MKLKKDKNVPWGLEFLQLCNGGRRFSYGFYKGSVRKATGPIPSRARSADSSRLRRCWSSPSSATWATTRRESRPPSSRGELQRAHTAIAHATARLRCRTRVREQLGPALDAPCNGPGDQAVACP
jgi:hypothetical protein